MRRTDRYPYQAGVWEQQFGFVEWSRHQTPETAARTAVRYARAQTSRTGGALTWAGGWTDGNGRVHWVDRHGQQL